MFTQKLERILFYLLLFFLPTQLGKHFWPNFAIISGIRVDYLSPVLYFTDILIGSLFIFWFINRQFGKRGTNASKIRNVTAARDSALLGGSSRQARMTTDKWFYMIFCFFILVNIVISNNIWNGFYHFLKLLEFSFVAYYVAITVKTAHEVKKIFLLLGIGVIGQSFLAVAQFIKQGSLGGIFYLFGERLFTAATPGIANASINGELLLRPYGTFPHPNVLAGFLLLSMVGLLFTLPWVKRFEKVIWITALFLGSSALLLTMSRTAFFLWFLLLVVVFLRQISIRFLNHVLGVGFVVLVVFLISQTPFGTRLIQTNLSEEAVVQRTELIRSSVEMVAQQPIVGVGFGNFLPMLATVANPLPLNLYLQPVHNIFLLALAETGFIGLGLFVWFLVKTYRRLFDLINKERALPYRLFVILLTVVLLLGSFDHYFLTLQQGQLLFAIILGFCWINFQKN